MVHTMAPGPFDDPRYAYHDVGSYNDDPEDKDELIKVKEEYQTLDKKVKAMNGNDICWF